MEHVRDQYWFAHERFASKAHVFYGDIYNLPEDLGHFDYAVICALLLHVRDPLRVVEGCAGLADNLVITDVHQPQSSPQDRSRCMSWFSTNEEPAAPCIGGSSALSCSFDLPRCLVDYHETNVTYHEQSYVAEGTPRPGSVFTGVWRRGIPERFTLTPCSPRASARTDPMHFWDQTARCQEHFTPSLFVDDFGFTVSPA